MYGQPHRKRVKHFDVPGHAHALTFSTSGRRPVLAVSGVAEIVLEAIAHAARRGLCRVIAFVVMPEHVHLMLDPRDEARSLTPMSAVLIAIKRRSSVRVRAHLEVTQPDVVVRFVLSGGGFRLWQPGGGYDRNIRSRAALVQTIEYVHLNPVRRGLCERPDDWAWSSARQWQGLASEVVLPEWMPVVDRGVVG